MSLENSEISVVLRLERHAEKLGFFYSGHLLGRELNMTQLSLRWLRAMR